MVSFGVQLFQPLTAYAVNGSVNVGQDGTNFEELQYNEKYQIYLADYLKQYPKLNADLKLYMLHRQVYDALVKSGTFYVAVDAYQKYTEYGRSGYLSEDENGNPEFVVYREPIFRGMLVEIMKKQFGEETAGEALKESFLANSQILMSCTADTLDVLPETLPGNGTIWTALTAKSAREAYEALVSADVMSKVVNEESFAVDWALSGAKALIAVADNAADYMDKLAMYLALSECRQGTLSTLKVMYRRTQDTDLRTALYKIITSIESAKAGDYAAALADLRLDTAWSAIYDVLTDVISDLWGVAGLIGDLTDIFLDVRYNVGNIVDMSRQLEALIILEDEIRGAVNYNRQTYHGEFDKACALNESILMLYDTYEYGTELTEAFLAEVYDKGTNNKNRNNDWAMWRKALQEDEETGSLVKESDKFDELIHSYEGFVDKCKVVFRTVWELYLSEKNLDMQGFLDIRTLPLAAREIKIPDTPLIIELGKNSSVTAIGASVIPAGAENASMSYVSSQPEVVSVDQNGMVTAHKAGCALITVTAAGGRLSASRQVIVQEAAEQAERPEGISLVSGTGIYDFTQYYTENEDGITLTMPLPIRHTYFEEHGIDIEALTGTKMNGNYTHPPTRFCEYLIIPAYIDGKPVTELDFQSGTTIKKIEEALDYWVDERSGLAGYDTYGVIRNAIMNDSTWKKHQMIEYIISSDYSDCYTVYLPDTVKRIGDYCFAGISFPYGVVLNEGLEEIGDYAFADADMWDVYLKEIEDASSGYSTVFKADPPDGHAAFTIPASVTRIGEGAFQCDFDRMNVEILAQTDEIPKSCFEGAERIHCLTFGEGSSLERIGESAFQDIEANVLCLPETVEQIEGSAFASVTVDALYLPETVEVIREKAFYQCYGIVSMPGQMSVIEPRAFQEARFSFEKCIIPDGTQKIGAQAFENSWGFRELYLPNSLEEIGSSAFAISGTMDAVYAYQCADTIAKDMKTASADVAKEHTPGILKSNALSAKYMELPENIVSFEYLNVGWELILPAGLEEMGVLKQLSSCRDSSLTIRVRDGAASDKQGEFRLYLDGGTKVDYLEVPGAFAAKFSMDGFSSKQKISEIRIKGIVKEIADSPGGASCDTLVSGGIFALNENGEEICLYRAPGPYDKTSQAVYEDPADYTAAVDLKTENIITRKISLSWQDSVQVSVNGDAQAIQQLEGEVPEIFGWKEDILGNRYAALGEYLYFEDLYLQQEYSVYFKVELQNSEKDISDYSGAFQVIAAIPDSWITNNLACYHVGENGLITRLKGQLYEENGVREFRALSEELGSFVLACMTKKTQKVQENWMEELHMKCGTVQTELTDEEEQRFWIPGGDVALKVKKDSGTITSSGKKNGQVTVQKTALSGAELYHVYRRTEAGGDSRKAQKDPEGAKHSMDQLATALKDNTFEIYAAQSDVELELSAQLPEGYQPVLLYLDGEDDGEVVQECRILDSTDGISAELSLEKPGKYLLLLTDEVFEIQGGLTWWQIVLLVIGAGIAGFLLILLREIQKHKRRMRNYRKRQQRRK